MGFCFLSCCFLSLRFKPIGALNPSRKQYFEERHANWEHDSIPPFHYGTHYSTSAFALNWLLRLVSWIFFYLFLFKWKIITCWIWKQYHFRCVCLSLSYRSLIRPCFWTCKVVNSTIPTGCSLPWRCHGATASETLQMSRYGMTLHQSLFWSLIFSLLFAALQELIPELFYLPELLVNANQYQMGQTEDNVTVSDAILPRWASSPEEFIRIHRMVR